MKRNIKKIITGVLVGVVLTIATLFTVLWVLLIYFVTSGPAKVTKDIGDYESIFTQPNINTAYIVFPERLPEGALETEFYNCYQDTFGEPSLQTYLKCVYDDATYQKEIDRLENTYKVYGNKRKCLLSDTEKKFQYPAYIAVENAAHKYEYALLTGENEIVYVNTSHMSRENIVFDEAYLPYDYMTDEGRKFGSGYSIYYGSVSASSINTYYTRDEREVVTDGHMRLLGDDSFMVRVQLDDEGKEVITACVYWKKLLGEANETETLYDDLNGMEYVSMEVADNRKAVVVHYREDGEEKQKRFEFGGE